MMENTAPTIVYISGDHLHPVEVDSLNARNAVAHMNKVSVTSTLSAPQDITSVIKKKMSK